MSLIEEKSKLPKSPGPGKIVVGVTRDGRSHKLGQNPRLSWGERFLKVYPHFYIIDTSRHQLKISFAAPSSVAGADFAIHLSFSYMIVDPEIVLEHFRGSDDPIEPEVRSLISSICVNIAPGDYNFARQQVAESLPHAATDWGFRVGSVELSVTPPDWLREDEEKLAKAEARKKVMNASDDFYYEKILADPQKYAFIAKDAGYTSLAEDLRDRHEDTTKEQLRMLNLLSELESKKQIGTKEYRDILAQYLESLLPQSPSRPAVDASPSQLAIGVDDDGDTAASSDTKKRKH